MNQKRGKGTKREGVAKPVKINATIYCGLLSQVYTPLDPFHSRKETIREEMAGARPKAIFREVPARSPSTGAAWTTEGTRRLLRQDAAAPTISGVRGSRSSFQLTRHATPCRSGRQMQGNPRHGSSSARPRFPATARARCGRRVDRICSLRYSVIGKHIGRKPWQPPKGRGGTA